MKTLLTTASALACLATTGFAQTEVPGWYSKISIAATVTTEDESKYKESKPWNDHEAAIDADQNSSYTESWSMGSMKITNRQILEAMVDEELIDSIKGWSIAFVEANGFAGLVAHHKTETAVAVPADIVSFQEDDSVSVQSGKFTSKFSAKKGVLKETESEKYIDTANFINMGGIDLVGLDKGSSKWSYVEVDDEPVSHSYSDSGTITLSGGGNISEDEEDEEADDFPVIIEGKVSYAGTDTDDVSSYLPTLLQAL